MSAAAELLAPDVGTDDAESTVQEPTPWELRRRLPSELVHKAMLRWPGDVFDLTGIPPLTLKALRADRDHPRMYAIGKRLYTTHADLRAWFESHALSSGQTIRPATVPRGTKRPAPRRVTP
jgi:hypothetical protein